MVYSSEGNIEQDSQQNISWSFESLYFRKTHVIVVPIKLPQLNFQQSSLQQRAQHAS